MTEYIRKRIYSGENILIYSNIRIFGIHWSEYLFMQNCLECGELPCYADDATFAIASDTREHNQVKIVNCLAAIKTFLNNNDLTINTEKTTLCEIMVRQKIFRINGSPPELSITTTTGEHKMITAKQHIRLLGGNIQNYLSWKSHLLDGEKPVLSALRCKLGSLKHIGEQLPKKSRLTLVNGLVMSKFCFT